MKHSALPPNGGSAARDRLAAVLRSAGDLVTVDQASAVLGVDRVIAAKTLARWTRQGWLRRVRRGLYAPVPLAASADDRVIEDPWTLVPSLFGPGYVGGVSAAHHWDLTEQLFRTVFVYTARPVRRTTQTLYGTPFSVHHVARGMLFGTQPLWRGRVKIAVSDIHRTIVDMLSDPGAGGGGRHVADCVAQYFRREAADTDRAIAYADRLGNGAVFKRLGYLAERVGAPEALTSACRARLTAGYAKFDPSTSCPRLIRRWKLWVPQSWKTGGARE
jgi:predicted transcriptional regulator of viral defense system